MQRATLDMDEYKDIVEKVHSLQASRLRSVNVKGTRVCLENGPATKQCGLYWIYTNFSTSELSSSTPSPKEGSVIISDLVKRHADLSKACIEEIDNFRIVYSGIGGVGKKGHGGLRERILSEFGGGEGTGSLAIKGSSLNNFDKWRYSYVLWSEIEFKIPHAYPDFAECIELQWRIHYGWPICCSK